MRNTVLKSLVQFTAMSVVGSPLAILRGASCSVLLCLSGLGALPAVGADLSWRIVARADNDVVRVLQDAGAEVERFDDAATAVTQSPPGAGVLVLADQYPQQTTRLAPELFDLARDKKLRLYVEYPSFVPGLKLGEPKTLKSGHWGNILERTVVASDAFGGGLKRMRILMIHDAHYLPVEASQPHLVIARVAGYDDALYGLPKTNVYPILFEPPGSGVLVGTTKLSQFVTARYAPLDAWEPVWRMILKWVQPGAEVSILRWKPTVHPFGSPVCWSIPRGKHVTIGLPIKDRPLRTGLMDIARDLGFGTPRRAMAVWVCWKDFVRRSTTTDHSRSCGGGGRTIALNRPERWPWRVPSCSSRNSPASDRTLPNG